MSHVWKDCCKMEIASIWDITPPERLVCYTGKCPTCGQFIGLTYTSNYDAEQFLLGKDDRREFFETSAGTPGKWTRILENAKAI